MPFSQLTLLFAVLCGQVFSQDLFLGSNAASQPSAEAKSVWKLHRMDGAVAKGAVCLDGSAGGYYMREGGNRKKWLIFNEGGGWCFNTSQCYSRSIDPKGLGSSKLWPDTYTEGSKSRAVREGQALFDTPPFDAFTVVYAKYCDGGSMTGDATDVHILANGTEVKLYYRGRRLLDSLLEDLTAQGLAQSDEVLYAGCSAGGMTTYSHADYVRSRLPASVQFLALAEAMYSMEHNNSKGIPAFPVKMQWVYRSMNSSLGLNQDCSQAMGEADGWRCLFGANVAPFVKTPLFVLNSKYDTWQMKNILEVPCSPPHCDNATEALWVDYGRRMVDQLVALNENQGHGVFVANCPAHCQLGVPQKWIHTTVAVSSTRVDSMRGAFLRWYNSSANVNGRWIAAGDEKPGPHETCR